MADEEKNLLIPQIYPTELAITSTKELFIFSIYVDDDCYRFAFSPEWTKRIKLALSDILDTYEKEVRPLDVSSPKISTPSKSQGLGYVAQATSTAVGVDVPFSRFSKTGDN